MTLYIPWLNYAWFRCYFTGHNFERNETKFAVCKNCFALMNVETKKHNACPIIYLSWGIVKRGFLG